MGLAWVRRKILRISKILNDGGDSWNAQKGTRHVTESPTFSLWSPTNFHPSIFFGFFQRIYPSEATESGGQELLPCSALMNGQGCRIARFLIIFSSLIFENAVYTMDSNSSGSHFVAEASFFIGSRSQKEKGALRWPDGNTSISPTPKRRLQHYTRHPIKRD